MILCSLLLSAQATNPTPWGRPPFEEQRPPGLAVAQSEGHGWYLTFNEVVVHDADGDPIGTVSDQVLLDGNIHIDPFNLGLCVLSGCSNDLSVTNSLLQQSSLELEAKKTASFGQQWNVLWLPLGLVPIIPLVELMPFVAVYVEVEGVAEAGLRTSMVQELGVETSAGWDASNAGNPGSGIAPPSLAWDVSPPLVEGILESHVRIAVKPQAGLLLFIGGAPLSAAFLETSGFVQLDVTPLNCPWWELAAGYSVEAGVWTPATGFNIDTPLWSSSQTLSTSGGCWSGSEGDSVRWSRGYDLGGNEDLSAICDGDAGGYVMAGTSSVFTTGWLAEVDSRGAVIWSREYGAGILPSCVQQVPGGGYVVTGNRTSVGPGFVLRLDSTGAPLWAKEYVQTAPVELKWIEPTSDGGFVATGAWQEGLDVHVLVARLDADGQLLWSKRYGGPLGLLEGGVEVHETADGFIVLGRSQYQDPDDEVGHSSGLVLSLDPAGEVDWARVVGSNGVQRMRSLCEAPGGGLVLAGEAGSGEAFRAWVARLGPTGQIEWSRTYAGEDRPGLFSSGESGWDAARRVRPVDDGFLVVGSSGLSSSQDGWVWRLDGGGDVQWWKTFLHEDSGSPYFEEDELVAIQVRNDGAALVGTSHALSGTGARDGWLVKVASDGMLRSKPAFGLAGWSESVQVADTSSMVSLPLATSSTSVPLQALALAVTATSVSVGVVDVTD